MRTRVRYDYESEGRGFDSLRAHHILRLFETLRNQGFLFLYFAKFFDKDFCFWGGQSNDREIRKISARETAEKVPLSTQGTPYKVFDVIENLHIWYAVFKFTSFSAASQTPELSSYLGVRLK